MKKIIRIFAMLLLLLLVALFVLYLIGPSKFRIVRGVVINANREVVWDQINLWKNQKNWSPWMEKEKNMETKIEGTDGTVGSKFIWNSKSQGKGSQTITEIVPGERRVADLYFEDWGMHNNTSFNLRDSAGGTYIEWDMYGDNSLFGRMMQAVFSMDKMVGPDYEKGLSNLKKACESLPPNSEVSMSEVKENEFVKTTFAMIRRQMSMTEFNQTGHEFFRKSVAEITEYLKKSGIEIRGALCGIYFNWDEKGNKTDCGVAFPVSKAGTDKGEVTFITMNKMDCATVDYIGDYSKLKKAHERIQKWIAENNREQSGPVIEEYVTDPSNQPDLSKLLTRVWYPLKK